MKSEITNDSRKVVAGGKVEVCSGRRLGSERKEGRLGGEEGKEWMGRRVKGEQG